MKAEVEQGLSCLANIINHQNTIEIGSLNHVCCALSKDLILFEDSFLEDTLSLFLEKISLFQKNQHQGYGEALALVALDSLIFNLYARHKQIDNFRLNNSFYTSLSMSQMSGQISQLSAFHGDHDEKNLKKALTLIENIASSKSIFKKIKIILERNYNKDKNTRFTENLLETLEYILNKEKLQKDKYNENKQTLKFILQKKKTEINIELVNNIIFSNQLNKIINLLTEASDQVHMALSRIYFVGRKKEERKHFLKLTFSANDMLYNLKKYYIESYQAKIELFSGTKNPLFKFIKNYLMCFFLPTFKALHKIIQKLCVNDYESDFTFYKSSLHDFIEELPWQLIQFANRIYRLIDKHYRDDVDIPSVVPVKKLLVYCFWMDPDLIQEIFEDIEVERYQQICNLINNLFFASSIKKYSNNSALNNLQIQQICRLVESISMRIDEKIIHFDQNYIEDALNQESTTISNYFIEEPILNHDYQLIEAKLSKMQFTPKDARVFNMRKQTEAFIKELDSPIYKHYKQETASDFHLISTYEDENKQEDLHFITWMSVGGTQNYSEENHKEVKKQKKEKFKMETFSKTKIKQIEKLYNEFEKRMMEI